MARKTKITQPTTLPAHPKRQRLAVTFLTTRNDGDVATAHILATTIEEAEAHARRSIINLAEVVSVHHGYV